VGYCFLSYARADGKDPYFETFIEDFIEELRGRIGSPTAEGLVFRDSDSIELGAPWEAKLERALIEAKTFLAMLSPTYVQRPACGKEWACFEWRLLTMGGDNPPDLLLPLMWIPIPDSDVPPAIRRRQHASSGLGTSYAARGLRYVVQRGGPEYRDLLTALADHVRELARLHALPAPPALVAPDDLPNPFAMPAIARGSGNVPVVPGGPKHVEFVVVAARQLELKAERTAVTAYGAEGHDWCPYLPVLDKRIGLLVQKIALEEDLTAGFVPVTDNLIQYLQDARAKNTLVVLVVDVWSLRLASYRAYMNQFDRAERFVNAGVLVLWNFADGETLGSKQRLVDSLQVAFPNLTVMKDPQAFHEQLGTPDELVDKLRATLYVLRRRITDLGEVIRRAEGMAPIAKPLLVGPGGI
jgi:FxsC-like protein